MQVEYSADKNEDGTPIKIEYRVWNELGSKLSAGIINVLKEYKWNQAVKYYI